MSGSYAGTPTPSFRRTFTLFDAQAFAKLSGDYNPIHLDEDASRRTPAGFPVVHGVHAVLWALEEIATSLGDRKIVRVAATFQKYLFVDTMATLVVKARTADRFKAEIRTAAGKAIRIDLNLREFDALEEPLEEHNTLHADVGTSRPNILGFADLDGASGTIAANATLAAESFPNLSANIGARAVSSMAALSAIVGMRCPGLHSIFGSFAVDIDDSASPLTYRATSTDARFSLVEINVSGAGLDGSISAFLRDEPAMIRMDHVRDLVTGGEFSNVRALVIGASRGLGAATVALLSAGGANVIGTYRVRDEALERFSKSLDRVTMIPFDVRGDLDALTAAQTFGANQIYYFATPQIFRRNTPSFDAEQFARFSDFYVVRFAQIVERISASSPAKISVFYPSSIAIDERIPEMLEYRMAKVAGEVFCESLAEQGKINAVVRRLPRIQTDQTGNVVPVPAKDPVDTMLPIVRELSAVC